MVSGVIAPAHSLSGFAKKATTIAVAMARAHAKLRELAGFA
jgi:hypothetical protein